MMVLNLFKSIKKRGKHILFLQKKLSKYKNKIIKVKSEIKFLNCFAKKRERTT